MSEGARKKRSPRARTASTSTRGLASVRAAEGAPIYASMLARARSLGLVAAAAILPLGALAGSVAACGGAAPVMSDGWGEDAGAKSPRTPTPAQPSVSTASTNAAPRSASASASASVSNEAPSEDAGAPPDDAGDADAAIDDDADAARAMQP